MKETEKFNIISPANPKKRNQNYFSYSQQTFPNNLELNGVSRSPLRNQKIIEDRQTNQRVDSPSRIFVGQKNNQPINFSYKVYDKPTSKVTKVQVHNIQPTNQNRQMRQFYIQNQNKKVTSQQNITYFNGSQIKPQKIMVQSIPVQQMQRHTVIRQQVSAPVQISAIKSQTITQNHNQLVGGQNQNQLVGQGSQYIYAIGKNARPTKHCCPFWVWALFLLVVIGSKIALIIIFATKPKTVPATNTSSNSQVKTAIGFNNQTDNNALTNNSNKINNNANNSTNPTKNTNNHTLTTNLNCLSGFFEYKGNCISCPSGSQWNSTHCVVKKTEIIKIHQNNTINSNNTNQTTTNQNLTQNQTTPQKASENVTAPT